MKKLIVILVIVSFVVGTLLYSSMPEIMVTHWGFYGQPNGMMNRFWGVWLLPLLNVFMLGVFEWAPKFDSKYQQWKKLEKEYERMELAVIALLTYVYVLSLIWNIYRNFNLGFLIIPGVLIVMIMGFRMGWISREKK